MSEIAAGQAVIELLRAEGVEYVFGVTGLTTNSMVTQMYGREDIKFIDTRHEEGAILMAYGYSKSTGRPSVCMTTSGPGTINLAGGMSLALKGRAPVIAIAGDTAMEYIGRDGSQAFDLVNIFKPLTKMAFQATRTHRIPDLIREAFRVAMWGKQGPVLLDIPRDLLDNETLSDEMLSPGQYRAVDPKTSGDIQAVSHAAQLLLSAERPLLLAGGGVVDGEASDEAVHLAEILDMAMVPSYGHHDAIPNSHPNYIGPPGGRGSGEAHEAMNKADLILALGTKINQASSSWDYSVISQDTRIIQIDIDPVEVGRNYPVTVGVVGDAKRVAEQLIQAICDTSPDGKSNPVWKSEFQSMARRRIERLQSERALTADPMMPQQVYPELTKALPKGSMVTIDAGVAPGLSYDRIFF